MFERSVHGLEKALLRASRKIGQEKPFGFDIEPMLAEAAKRPPEAEITNGSISTAASKAKRSQGRDRCWRLSKHPGISSSS
jgi:hypothetical protein